MRLGYNTNGFAHHRLEDALQILAELGYESVAITLDYHSLDPFTHYWTDEGSVVLDRIQQLLTKHGMRCVIETGARFLLDPRRKHQPTLLDPSSAERERRYDFLRRAIFFASVLRADAVSFWSGAAPGQALSRDCWPRLLNACCRLADDAERHKVRLAFEPEPGMFIDTMDKFEKLHERVNHGAFGLTLDVGHLHCMNELPIADHIVRWKKWLWNIHIEDMRKGVHDHLMFGDGDMDFPPIFAALRAIDYQGGVHVELSRHSHDAVETARRAMAFLKADHETTK